MQNEIFYIRSYALGSQMDVLITKEVLLASIHTS